MMNDTLDSILDAPGDADEQDAIVNQVLDEIGIEMNSKVDISIFNDFPITKSQILACKCPCSSHKGFQHCSG